MKVTLTFHQLALYGLPAIRADHLNSQIMDPYLAISHQQADVCGSHSITEIEMAIKNVLIND